MTKKIFLIFLLSFFSFSGIEVGHASANSSATYDGPMTQVLCNAVLFMQEGAGKPLSIMALIALAVGLFFGKMSWMLAIVVFLGIALLFGAESIVVAIKGDNVGTTTTVATCETAKKVTNTPQ